MKIQTLGDCAVSVVLGDEILPEVHARVSSFCAALDAAAMEGVRERVPTYAGVTVHYDPMRISFDELCARLTALPIRGRSADEGPLTEVPVCYGGAFGPDLENVARHCGMTPEEVIAIHSSGTYLIYMLGFMPGFAYMGGMDERIATPRLKTPRTAIPAGSVGIAGKQTGIYPLPSPGGWQLIGQTPLRLFDVHRTPQTLLSAGMRVRFVPITPEEFAETEARR